MIRSQAALEMMMTQSWSKASQLLHTDPDKVAAKKEKGPPPEKKPT